MLQFSRDNSCNNGCFWFATPKIEYGDCMRIANPEVVAREAVKRFCPMKFTKGVLPHDLE